MASNVGVQSPLPHWSQRLRGWLVVAQEEFRNLWLEGRALVLLLGVSLLLSVVTYLVATNQELTLLSQVDTVNLTMHVTVAVGVVLALVMSADALSGEREAGTLEALLLTPLSRRQIAMGKLVAYLTVWPAVLVIAVPYMAALAKGTGTFSDAIITGTLGGTLLAVAFACLGLTVSALARSNRVSLSVSLFIFVALLAPTQLPGGALKGWLGTALDRVNPMTAVAHYMDLVLIDNHGWTQDIEWLASPLLAALTAVLVAAFITSRLRLNGGMSE